jgi:hypothetical protein
MNAGGSGLQHVQVRSTAWVPPSVRTKPLENNGRYVHKIWQVERNFVDLPQFSLKYNKSNGHVT